MRKSFSLSSYEEIRRHPANNSLSKNAHAFSKSSRFQKPNPECKVAYYQQHESQLSKRRASFGYGTKSDFTKALPITPSPGNYEIKSIFNRSKETGRSFGLARQSLPDQLYTVPQLAKNPGPGQYEQNWKTISASSKYSMRIKYKDFIEQKLSFKFTPGPGAYETVDLQPKTGRVLVGKFVSLKMGKIDPNCSRFENRTRESPSTFHYRQKDGINKDARYILSKNKSAGTRAFTITKRLTFIDDCKKKTKNLPGPGYYDKPSQFGIYGTYEDSI